MKKKVLNHTSEIESIKEQYERQQKSILYFIVEHFKHLYDPRKEINEQLVKDIIIEAEKQLENVNKT